MMTKRVASIVLSASLLFSGVSSFAADEYLTRGEAADMLVTAADDYNDGITVSDIMSGYEDGSLREDSNVTRAEMLVMLERAFGDLPEPAGHNARVAIPAEKFTDVPEWARTELSDVLGAGIAAGTGDGYFSPDEPVTKDQAELFIERTYSIFGTNPKDDFYAAVNKEALETMDLIPGLTMGGAIYDLNEKATAQIKQIIEEITSAEHDNGTPEQKLSDMYKTITAVGSGSYNDISPLRKYLDMVDSARTAADLADVNATLSEEICCAPLMDFSVVTDMKDSTKHIVSFDVPETSFTKDFYEDTESKQYEIFMDYMSGIFMLGGEDEAKAREDARLYFEFEKTLAGAAMNREDYSDVDKSYNIFTMDELKNMFSGFGLDAIYSASLIGPADRIAVTDVGLTQALACYIKDENLEELKAYMKMQLLLRYGSTLSRDFGEASNEFSKEILGTDSAASEDDVYSMQLQDAMPEYIGRLYSERFFSEEAKRDVENMVREIVDVYKERIDVLDWMSDATKAGAQKKLDTLMIKVGYPDSFECAADNAEILPPEDGGSYFINLVSLKKAEKVYNASLLNEPVDKSEWALEPFTVNAYYTSTSNDITFPAAILQEPLYDVNASFEENLGGIGFIIAHEITHAFDNNGAKFDENGNAADWWAPEDYETFSRLCADMITFYDGCEGIPGIPMNGTLTLSENIADQGAVQCITEIESRREEPDFRTLYISFAKSMAATTTRSYAEYAASFDYHSNEKLRVNRTVVNCPEFYEAFGISETDGMWVAPEDRVRIW
ncbi:MAG TPA: S-layer homology domain-containing protein [Candidatus Ornithomonoglobus merdipullorum]|uniref:S-layer homology domain-containing protein n=1 Tax=Candidatus Ornithomonoglobus merdipullorum TaxID=2840895 RepID=A0A9D1MAT7_9FIRM|nr:S-layer homology domain-containing protein [Candidatus Ornithomonoglobus merdipullorum]